MERHAMKHANGLPVCESSTPPMVSGNNTFSKTKKILLKKKEKEGEVVTKQPKTEVLQAEQEIFLQAFEKPSQIYRFLGTRNKLQPIFMHRNLSYMRNRMSRSHKSRQSFKIDTMLAQKLSKLRTEKANGLSASGEFLSLLFLGFFDKNNPTNRKVADKDGVLLKDAFENGCDDDEQKHFARRCVLVDTYLLKISHNKRKDISSTLMQLPVGKSKVLVNPKEDQVTLVSTYEEKTPVVRIPTEFFSTLGSPNHVAGPQLSFLLLFRVHYNVPAMVNHGNGCYGGGGNDITNADGVSDNEEPSAKRQKLHTYSKLYSTELAIFDKQGRYLLKEADYELTVQEMLPQQTPFVPKYISPMKNWYSLAEGYETMDYAPSDDCSNISKNDEPREELIECFEEFIKLPTLKFRLQWTKEPVLEVPLAIGNGCNDKENYKPPHSPSESFKKSLNININNNSILTPAAAGHLVDLEQDVSSSDGSDSPPDVKPVFLADNKALVPSGSNTSYGAGSINDAVGMDHATEVKRVIYQLIHNNYSRQQTETSEFICPWCGINCCILYSLLKHLKLCHARFVFNFVPIPNGARIDVSINELYDGSYNGSPHDLLGPSIGITRRGPVRRTVVTNLLVCRPRRQKPSLSEFIDADDNEFDSQRPYITGHSRMYHHTMTCLPVYPRELDIDSEGESDPLWLQHKAMQMIDEFTDVNEGEKELMKMWNLHVMKYGYVGDCQIPIALEMFIERRGSELWERNLYRNFVLHMCSMFDFGLVSADVMQRTIRKLRKIPLTDLELQQQIRKSRVEQMSYWNNVTIHKQPIVKTEPRNGAGERASVAGTCSTSGSLSSYHLHKTGLVGSGSVSAGAGDGLQRKVKPIITPAKNTDPSAISPPRRRSTTAAVNAAAKSQPTSTTTATQSSNQSSSHSNASTHSIGTLTKNGSGKTVSKAAAAQATSSSLSSGASASKKTSTASTAVSSTTSSSISSSNNKHSHSVLKVMLSPVMTRRKSLSLGTHLIQSQRKRSLN